MFFVFYSKRGYSIFFLVIGIICTLFGFWDVYTLKGTPMDYNTVTSTDIKWGKILEGELSANYGAFLESYQTDSGRKIGSSSFWYLIPVAEDKYMALSVYDDNLKDSLQEQAQAVQDYLNGTTTEIPETIHFRGTISSLSGDYLKNARNYLLGSGFSESEIDQCLLPYYVKQPRRNLGTIFVIAGISYICAVIFFIIEKKKRR